MATLNDKSIDLTVTSPPYDNLRKYNGFTFDHEAIAQQLYRVTKPGGVVVWVVGDATIKGSETGTSFKQALYFMGLGFNLHDTMIWEKTNALPLTHNRYEPVFEYMFVFSKDKPKTWNPILIPCKLAGKSKNHGRYNATSILTENGACRCRDEISIYKEFKQKGNVWQIAVAHNTKHPAIFPAQLAHDHIISWSNPGDAVLDPMCGSGTTLVEAAKLGRDYIGIDCSEEYCELSRERLNDL
jgi:site-specific DNA-methyltransferase (adenine-specific)